MKLKLNSCSFFGLSGENCTRHAFRIRHSLGFTIVSLNCSVIRQKAVECGQCDTASVFHTTNVIREITNAYENYNNTMIYVL